MANVQGKFYTAETQRRGVTPVSPPNAVDDPQDPVSPSSPVSFITLTDTPSSYSGQTLKGVRVNAAETGLEFYTISSGGLPPIDGSYASQALMIADQSNQTAQYIYFDGTEYWEYLGTTTPSIADYRAISTSTGGSFISYAVAQGLTGSQMSQSSDNIGSTSGSIETISNTGVVTLNNLVIAKSNIEFDGSSTVTLTGIVPLWMGQEVTIWNRTGNLLTILQENVGSTTTNRFWGKIIVPTNSPVRIKYVNANGTFRWSVISTPFFSDSLGYGNYTTNGIGIGSIPINNVSLYVKTQAAGGTAGFRIGSNLDVTLFENLGSLMYCRTQMDFTRTTGGFYNLTVNATNAAYWSVAFRNTGGTDQASVNNTGGYNGLGDSSFGISALYAVANTRVAIRGKGTTTQNTLLLEDSAGTDNARFLDNGKIQFLRLPTSSAGLAAGDLWNNAGVINIV